jgi:catalase
MQGGPVPVTARLSNGHGHPGLPDFTPDVRGLAVKFHLADGAATDLVAQTVPHFPVSTPEAFLELVHALAPAPSSAWRLPRFLLTHPRAAARLARDAGAVAPPPSYATCTFYAIHAYRFDAADGSSRWVRYTLRAEQTPGRAAPRRLDPDYLQRDIRARLARGPVRWFLHATIASPQDDVEDPSREWPRDRETVDLGTLELTAPLASVEEPLVFDPTRVVDGIGLSEDPVLHYRHDAYSESVRERMAER